MEVTSVVSPIKNRKIVLLFLDHRNCKRQQKSDRNLRACNKAQDERDAKLLI